MLPLNETPRENYHPFSTRPHNSITDMWNDSNAILSYSIDNDVLTRRTLSKYAYQWIRELNAEVQKESRHAERNYLEDVVNSELTLTKQKILGNLVLRQKQDARLE